MLISRRTAVIFHDLTVTAIAWELAWLARFNFVLPQADYWSANLKTLPFVVATQAIIFWRFGLYRGLWRFASVPDLLNILRAAGLGVVTITLVLFIATRLQDVPRSLLILYPVFLIFLLGGPRLGYRLLKDHSLNLRGLGANNRVLVVGGGRAGETLVRHMLSDRAYTPIGFIDDKESLRKSRIHGLPVLGSVEELPAVVAQTQPDFVVIAIPSADNRQMRRIVTACELSRVRFRTLPKVKELATGASYVSELRDVSIEDLLGRDKVELDWQRINRGLAGKTILVTGGGGSIGSELCRQLARIGPAKLLIYDQSEFNLFEIERELRTQFPQLDLVIALGDICDAPAVESMMAAFKPNVVFHAAAYKHVPMLQHQPRIAIRNNILGTQVVARAAMQSGCRDFVLISTDKVVNPTSVMGLCKRVAELLCESLKGQSETRFITVRFGNVLGSAGSVVPLFQEQIRNGGPVTVTHPEVSRYFMTIPEACQLIMQASVMGEGGEIFVLEMGEPVKIAYMAEQMVRLAGFEPGEEIPVQFVGLRPGEKLFEELFYVGEESLATEHDQIRRAKHRHADWNAFNARLQHLLTVSDTDDAYASMEALRALVPEFNEVEPVAETGSVIPLKPKLAGVDQ